LVSLPPQQTGRTVLEADVLGSTRVALLARSAGLSLVLVCGLAAAAPDTGDQLQGPRTNRLLPANHALWCTQCNHGEGLPAYDIRTDDAIYSALASAAAQKDAAKGEAAAAKLRALIPSLAVDFDESLGTPKFIRATEGFLTGQRAGVAWTTVVGDFVTANRSMTGFDADELSGNRVTRDVLTKHNGMRSLTVQQTHEGVDIFGATLRFSITARGELISFSSFMLDRPVGGFTPAKVTVEAASAIVAAAADAGVTIDRAELAIQEDETGADRRTVWKTPAALRADEKLETKLVYFPIRRGVLVPAWTVVVPQHGLGHTYDTVIDATDGKVLVRTNRLMCASPITFNVYTGDSPAPMSPGLFTTGTAQAPIVSRNIITVTTAEMTPYSPLGWITDGNTQTLGNNVDAHTDTDANNAADIPRPDGGASLNFDFPLDLALAPSGYQAAAVTQMFYLSNRYHDRLYSLGFDEPAGNFQTNNFGLGGTGNDAVQADVQDGSGTNNANFSTNGTDGSTGRCQMYVWTGPNPDRDGALESDVVFHELTHGTSIRLHGALSSTQPAGMGEGWSDFVALSINSQPGDDPDACYTMGPYATYLLSGLTRNYYFGIRRYPYSTDMNKGPLTLGDIDTTHYDVSGSVPRSAIYPASSNSDAHDYGEVWCQILWECRAGMIHAHGFAGNEMILQLVIDGMKISTSNPTFIQARDAIIAADNADNGGANLSTLWTAFAKRGIGTGASVPAASSTTGVVESFVTPTFATFTFPDGLPTQLSPSTGTQFHVNIVGTGLTLTADSGTLSYRVNGGAFTTVPMASTGTDQYLATIPPLPCLSRVDYYVSVDSNQGVRSSPASAPSNFNAATVFTSTVTLVNDTFETNTGWTVGPDSATTGGWVRVNPVGTTAQPEDDHTPGAGQVCWVTGQGSVGGGVGDADIDGGQVFLTSPAFDLSAVGDATVSYWRWYSNGTSASPYSDVFRVQVSTNNGSLWTAAETVGPANSPDTNPGWRFASWSLSSLGLTPTSQVKVRFIAEDAGAGSLVEAAVDDFMITGLQCVAGPQPCGPADLAQQGGLPGADGVLDNNDFVIFIDKFFAHDPLADKGIQGGIPGSDGVFDNNDFVIFIDQFFAGCP
jgi:hypothetical protein